MLLGVKRLRDLNAATMDFLSCTQGGHPPPPEHYAVAIYPDSVYVTGDGDCYHLNLSCAGLGPRIWPDDDATTAFAGREAARPTLSKDT